MTQTQMRIGKRIAHSEGAHADAMDYTCPTCQQLLVVALIRRNREDGV